MRISLLLQRESFGAIFTETLKDFFEEQYGISYQIRWYEKNPGIAKIAREGFYPWLCNPMLNVTFAPGVALKAFEPAKNEFSRSLSWWKIIPQRLYVAMATRPPFYHFFASSALGIRPEVKDKYHLLIVGGNHRIRILNHQTGEVFVVVKKGFPDHFLRKEIALRKKFSSILPMPPLLKIGKNQTWFSEQYVVGTPLNRLPSPEMAKLKLKAAATSLEPFLLQNVEEISLSSYVERLCERIRASANHISLLSEREKSAILAWMTTICDLIFTHFSKEEPLSVTKVHGDFQDGNILSYEDGIWIIDWEYSEQRQIGYDALVYTLKSRFPTGLAERISDILHSQAKDDSLLLHWPKVDWRGKQQKIKLLLVFLLEELTLYLQENDNPLFFRLSGGLEQFVEEMPRLNEVFQ